ncbi:MAG: glycosyltransferase family 4 protein, partial [Candidatus Lokiarchaeota archaeon]|nr:glycosyltransferase family 4 protein [Candidatus Lokiarchaeota archaeon]
MIDMNILYISPNFDYTCGVSRNVYQCLKHFASDENYEVHFISNKGDSFDRIKKLNIKFYQMNFEKDHKNPLRLLKDFFFLYSYCKKNNIHLIHSHHRYLELLAVIVSKFTSIKTITTVHSFVTGLSSLSFRSDKIICVSNAVKENLIKHYQRSSKRIILLHNCIDDTFFKNIVKPNEIRAQLGLNSDDKVILFAGRINTIKGVDTLLEAFKKVHKLNVKVKLILLGQLEDIDLSEAIRSYTDKLIVIPPKNNVLDYYQVADIVVLPSRIDPFPFVMLEAGAMKKPFIGSRTGGIAEYVEDGVNGFLFEPGNNNELAQKIIYIIQNPESAKQAAEKLHDKVIEKSNCSQYFEKLEKIYSEILN